MTVTAREARENSKTNDVENMVTESEIIEQFGNNYVEAIDDYKAGYNIHIITDSDPCDPLEWDNLGTMVCFHNRYDLGDEDHGYSRDDCESWSELEGVIESDQGDCVFLRLWLYDHSGLAMQTYPFACDSQGWDSGVVGVIFITRAKIREEYSAKRISRKLEERVTGYLKNEVQTYSDYIGGFCYGWVVTGPDGDEIDSCWGYYGTDYKKNGLLAAAHATIDCDVTQREKFAMRS